jgi:hypothetical protein
MEPRLIPVATEAFTDKIDYTQGLIVRQYLQDGTKYYFMLHQEHYMDVDGQIHIGRYLTVILSPKGLRSFCLVADDSGIYVMDKEEEDTSLQRSMVNEQGQLITVIDVGG